MVEPISVVIENWQITSIFETWAPIIIGILALMTSVFSIWFSIKIFRQSSRPYISAINYCILEENRLINQNEVILFRVYNSPAKVFRYSLKLIKQINGKEQIINDTKFGFSVHYPDEEIKWWGCLTKDLLNYHISLLDDNCKLFRQVEIHYSSLLGGKKYKYLLKQRFDEIDNQWDDVLAYAT
jgi:hypothetical protein